jgi:hypothetical protein
MTTTRTHLTNGTLSRNGTPAPAQADSTPSFIALDKGAEARDSSTTADGRDSKTGRFLKGAWKGGQGNPF